ncbi:MAG: TIGR02996 domain-containing protein [Planctomycetes bacterium]|nr:TIGR02996 domain-containing protein [Planctomycetota bacterium]
MTDREALLRAVAANPDEDTPRLAYADLLDELGGAANVARARFVRLQIDLVRNPGRSWFASSERLCESAQLAGQFADVWLNELPKWAADEARKQRLRADDFPRGFLDAFHVNPGTFAAQGNQLLDAAPVTRIVAPARHLKRTGLRVFLHSPFLLRVRALAVPGADGHLTTALVSASQALSAVEEFDLSGCGLTDADAATLARSVDLGSLRVLIARGNRLTAAGTEALLSATWLPRLTTLDIRGATDGYRWVREVRLRHPGKTVLV